MKNTDIPKWLVEMCHKNEGRKGWLAGLPAAIADLQQRWGLSFERPFARVAVDSRTEGMGPDALARLLAP